MEHPDDYPLQILEKLPNVGEIGAREDNKSMFNLDASKLQSHIKSLRQVVN